MKNNKGITLVALVITIIVLLILAGVSISMVSGDDGIISRASSASEKTNEATAQEVEDLEESKDYIDNFVAGNYKVTFNYNDATGMLVAKSLWVAPGGTVTASEIPTPEQYESGSYKFTFSKWVIKGTNTAVSNFSNITESIELEAVYTQELKESICFVAGTKVLTENGLVNIEDVKVGMKVYSYNEETEEVELKEVKNTFINTVEKDMVKVTVNSEVIESTSKHEYYVVGNGWTKAFELEEGDILLNNEGEEALVENVELIISDGNEVTVYNMEVIDNHNYFIGEESVLVHNNNSAC